MKKLFIGMVSLIGLVNIANAEISLREVSKDEIDIMKTTSSAGKISFSVKSGARIVDQKGKTYRLLTAHKGTYTLADGQSSDCIDKVKESKSDTSSINNQGELVDVQKTVEVADEAQAIEIDMQIYKRFEKRKIFGGVSEQFCIFNLKSSEMVTAVAGSSGFGMNWSQSIPVVVKENTELTTNTLIDYSVEQYGWHPPGIRCNDKSCAIPVGASSNSTVILNYAPKTE